MRKTITACLFLCFHMAHLLAQHWLAFQSKTKEMDFLTAKGLAVKPGSGFFVVVFGFRFTYWAYVGGLSLLAANVWWIARRGEGQEQGARTGCVSSRTLGFFHST